MLFINDIYANYIVISNGEVIEGVDIHKTQSVASISKIMTALIAIEYGNITDEVIISKKASQQIGSSLYMFENERYSLLSLIHGLLLRSGNDAAYAIAEHLGGIETFVSLMNQKAKELNMNNTVFSNPSGLDEEDNGNISSVYDMALCMQEAMKNDIFKAIIKTRQYKAENQRIWINKNKLLLNYEFCNGGKTGYTKKSGKTLITSTFKNGVDSIVVSFREDNYFMLHKQIHEKINNEYKIITLIKKGKYKRNNKVIIINEDIKVLLKNDEKIDYELKKNKNEYIVYINQLDKIRKVVIHDNILE